MGDDGVSLKSAVHPHGSGDEPDDVNPDSVVTTELTKEEALEWLSKRVWTGLRFERKETAT